jgi:hypothetical protein
MNQRDKIVEKARGEIGYKEGYNNDTKYGIWYGMNNQPWCAMFVSWCAHEAGIGEDIVPKFVSCTAGFKQMLDMGIAIPEKITPNKGDLIFFDWDLSGDKDHVGIVEYVENGVVHTIEGNHTNDVTRFQYPVDYPYIAGYAQPHYQDLPDPGPTPVPTKVETKEDVINYISGKYYFEYDWVCRDTINAILQAFQVETGCDVNGIIDCKTKAAFRNNLLLEGMSGNLVEIVQCALIMKNHPVSGFGNFDEDTGNEVENYQREKHLRVDRKVGQQTYTSLFTR